MNRQHAVVDHRCGALFVVERADQVEAQQFFFGQHAGADLDAGLRLVFDQRRVGTEKLWRGGNDLVAFDLRAGRLSLGPSAAVGFEWEQFTFSLGDADYSYGTARMRLQAGLDLRWFFSRRVGMVLSPKVGWTTNRGVYRAQTSNDVIVATPRNEWGFSLGVVVRPWR